MGSQRILFNIIFVFLLISSNPASAYQSPDFTEQNHSIVNNELIIQYKKIPLELRKLNASYLAKGLGQDPVRAAESVKDIDADYVAEAVSEAYALKIKHQSKFRSLLDEHSFNKVSKVLKRRIESKNNYLVIELDESTKTEELLDLISSINARKLKTNSFVVEAAYPNHLCAVDELSNSTKPAINDTFYDKQWGLTKVEAASSWQYSKGDGVIVAVIDTGVDYTHKDLADNIWTNSKEIPANGKDDDGNGFVDDIRGWDFVKDGGQFCVYGEDCSDRDADPMDVQGHGTHVAGIIAAVQNNELGISGVAPLAKIMPVRAAFSTGATALLKTSDILEALSYAINNGADVINMSFAGSDLSVLLDVLNIANDLNVVVVAAAGNSNSTGRVYPAAFDSVISVGALSSNNTRASFSNYGDWVDIAAPGVNILSTLPNNNFGNKSGTSMAAPFVAGAAALIKSKNKLQNFSPEQVKEEILSNSLASQFPTSPDLSGFIGALNLNIKYTLAVDDIEVPSNGLFGQKITLSGSGSDSSSDIVAYEWESDIDGFLSDSKSFSVDNLSIGSHTISFKVQNSFGEWSDPVYNVLTISNSKVLGSTSINDIAFNIAKKHKLLIARSSKQYRNHIRRYKWLSSKDGNLSNKRIVPLEQLSSGFHRISLTIQDESGNWSKPLEKVIEVKGS
jgi:subtilisin family serine protease